jgi:nuclease-like protein
VIKLTALLLPLTLLTAPRLTGAEFSAVVVDVYDGDTLTVLDHERTVKIRLSGIDCPERNQPFGDQARRFTADLAIARIVTIVDDKTDRYGRLVAWVILPDGRNLNEEIVAAGWACGTVNVCPGVEYWLRSNQKPATDAGGSGQPETLRLHGNGASIRIGRRDLTVEILDEPGDSRRVCCE